MRVKKTGGKVYGAVLTTSEKKALDMEIKRQLAEMLEQEHSCEKEPSNASETTSD